MSGLPVVSGMHAIKAFSKAGLLPHRQVGSHVVLRKKGSKVTLTVPKHKELKLRLLRNLIKVSGLTIGVPPANPKFRTLRNYRLESKRVSWSRHPE